MKRKILEVVRINQKENVRIINNTENEYRAICYINPLIFVGFCGQRYDTIYCDEEMMDDWTGRHIINDVFQPMLTLKHPDGQGLVLCKKEEILNDCKRFN